MNNLISKQQQQQQQKQIIIDLKSEVKENHKKLKQMIRELRGEVKQNRAEIKNCLKYNDFGDAAHLDSVNSALEHAIHEIEWCGNRVV